MHLLCTPTPVLFASHQHSEAVGVHLLSSKARGVQIRGLGCIATLHSRSGHPTPFHLMHLRCKGARVTLRRCRTNTSPFHFSGPILALHLLHDASPLHLPRREPGVHGHRACALQRWYICRAWRTMHRTTKWWIQPLRYGGEQRYTCTPDPLRLYIFSVRSALQCTPVPCTYWPRLRCTPEEVKRCGGLHMHPMHLRWVKRQGVQVHRECNCNVGPGPLRFAPAVHVEETEWCGETDRAAYRRT